MNEDQGAAIMEAIQALKGNVERLSNMVVFTTPEAAEYMRCTEDWLRRAAKANLIPHFLVGRDIRWRKVDLDAYTVTPAGQKAMAKLANMRMARAANY